MNISYHGFSDQNDHGYQYYYGTVLLKCAGDVQKVPTHKSTKFYI